VSLSIGGEQRNSILLAVISGELPLQRPFPTLSDFRLQLPFPTLLDFATPSEVGKASRGRSSQLRGGSPPHPRRESSSAFISPSKKRERTGASSSSDFFLSPLPPFPPFPTSASPRRLQQLPTDVETPRMSDEHSPTTTAGANNNHNHHGDPHLAPTYSTHKGAAFDSRISREGAGDLGHQVRSYAGQTTNEIADRRSLPLLLFSTLPFLTLMYPSFSRSPSIIIDFRPAPSRSAASTRGLETPV
jgi:hypothetical protein